MLKMDVKGVRAFPMEKEPLTAGRVGLQIAFTFSPDWDDLEKIAVFEGSGTYVVPLVATDTCVVPHEALGHAGPSLKVGVYGMKNLGDELVRATPTVWANFGRIESGSYPAANEGENTVPPTPSDVDTILAAAEDAVETANDAKDLAQRVADAAERGDFDGSQLWKSSAAPSSSGGAYIFDANNLTGDPNMSPAVGDIIFYSYYYYNVTNVIGDEVTCATRTYIRGAAGTNGSDGSDGYSVWFTNTAPTVIDGFNTWFYSELYGPDREPKRHEWVFYDTDYYKISGTAGGRVIIGPSPVSLKGEDGVGVPSGGSAGQVLEKASDTDYVTRWVSPHSNARFIIYTESGGVVTSDRPYTYARAAASADFDDVHSVAKLALSNGKTLGSASVKIDEDDRLSGVVFTFVDGTNGYKITHDSNGITLNTFTIGGGGGGTSDYDDLTDKPQINSVTLSGNKSTSDLGLDQVFWAVAGSTHNDVIHSAHAAGKIVLVEISGRIYQMTEEVSFTKHRFTCADQGAVYWIEVSNDLWDADPTSRAIPVKATSTPTNLGTAAIGSSTKYAAENHVHENNIFAVTYTKTGATTATCDKTFADIVAAATAGKTVVAVLAGLFPATQTAGFSIASETSFKVVAPIGGTGNITISHTSADVISFSQAYGQEEITASGILKGNGAGGVSAAVSGTDYIAPPGSPSAGDVLTYSGGAWAAAAPAHQIPAGGNAGECLAKNSASDYDLRWRTINDWTPAGLIRTNGGTAAKVAEWSFWDDTHYPQILYITLGLANTAASALTLKVNGKGPYPIYIDGAASSATNYTLPAGSYLVYFDGTNFYFDTTGKIPSAMLPVYNGGVS